MEISVIIPALNEAADIGAAVASALEAAEVIVVDAESTDDTAAEARRAGAFVIRAPRGRGGQMDSGAMQAKGDVLVFLHADTLLPKGWQEGVRAALADKRVVAGAFRLSVAAPGMRFRLLEALANSRARVLGLVYGDQAIFARKEAFFSAGGFRKLPLMEDVDCVRRLRGQGRVVLLKESVATSKRRWEKRGVVGNALKNLFILALYYAGMKPERLYPYYYKN
ncbi:MAG TPA: TIGR04283 family arsenosugar biosynthesis glycosyltransferase [Thermodesulfobacteriota bacterium]